jgi:hypothetical protein
MDTVADPRFQALIDELGVPITFSDLNKASKYQVMIKLCHYKTNLIAGNSLKKDNQQLK